jgi:hypothetical protein
MVAARRAARHGPETTAVVGVSPLPRGGRPADQPARGRADGQAEVFVENKADRLARYRRDGWPDGGTIIQLKPNR